MWAAWVGIALGATFEIDFKIAATILVDDRYVAQFWVPGVARVELEPGEHTLSAIIQGSTRKLPLTMTEAPLRLIVGSTGISTEQIEAAAPVAVESVTIKWQCAAGEPVLVIVDRDRFVISPGRPRSIGLPPGDHRISVRSVDGVTVYAQGTLQALGDGTIQVAAGMLPEMSGDGLRFLGP